MRPARTTWVVEDPPPPLLFPLPLSPSACTHWIRPDLITFQGPLGLGAPRESNAPLPRESG